MNRLRRIETKLGFDCKPPILLRALDGKYLKCDPWGSDNVVKEFTPQEVDQLEDSHTVIIYQWGD